MGMALPKGKVRLYKRDEADGSLEFIGEDQIDHTPKDETVKLHIGDAFDVVGERKRTNFSDRCQCPRHHREFRDPRPQPQGRAGAKYW